MEDIIDQVLQMNIFEADKVLEACRLRIKTIVKRQKLIDELNKFN